MPGITLKAATMAHLTVLLLGASAQVFADGQPPASPTFSIGNTTFQVYDPQEARRHDPFMILHDRPMTDSAELIPQLMTDARTSTPKYAYELARRLWPTDQAAALEWVSVGMARASYDATRCVDPSSQESLAYLGVFAPDVIAGIQADRKAFGEAGTRAMAHADLFSVSPSPLWICSQGHMAVSAAYKGQSLSETDLVRPASEWPALQEQVRQHLVGYFAEQSKPQDDPIAMTQLHYPRQTLPAQSYGAFSWLDDDHLLISVWGKGSDGKRQEKLQLIDPAGASTDVATTNGIWCAGAGVVSYQSAIEKLEKQQQLVTLAVGKPGQWTSSSVQLQHPFLDVRGTEQSFMQVYRRPATPLRQSPIDCRWQRSEALSGTDNATQWVPLLAGEGAVALDQQAGLRWIPDSGEPVSIPVAADFYSPITLQYLGWKHAYYFGQSWKWSNNSTAPTCLAGAIVYPQQRRIEKVCPPFDPNNTSNAVRYLALRQGWLRISSYRNTPVGRKPGGLYKISDDGTAEKLLEADISGWNMSPDGCHIALSHSQDATAGKPDQIDIMDVCRGK